MLYLILIAFAMLAVFYCIGLFINYILDLKYINSVVTGFIVVIALFYIISFAFMYFTGDFLILLILYAAICLIVLGVSVYVAVKKNLFKPFNINIKNNKIMIISIVVILCQIICVVILEHSDADDSYYLAITNSILESGKVNAFEPSTGIREFVFQQQYSLVPYEVWVACLCKITGINTAVFYHTMLPIVLLILHYFITYDVAYSINKEKASLFLFGFSLMNLFSGYSVYSSGAFAMFRIWQGKSVLVNIIFPALLLVIINIFMKTKVYLKEIILITLLLISGLFCSTIGVYIVLIAYAVYTFSFMICTGKLKDIMKMCIPVVCILPIIAIIYFRIVNGANMDIITNGAKTLSYWDVIRSFAGESVIFILFALALLYFVFYGRRIQKQVFCVVTIISFATVLNPLLCNFLAEKITGTPVYWRLFWILQMNYCIVSFLCEIRIKSENRIKYLFYIPAVIAVLMSVSFIFNDNNFVYPANREKIPAITKYISDEILTAEREDNNGDNCRLFIPEEYGYGVRQYTGDILLVWSRYSSDIYKELGNYEELWILYSSLYNDKNITEGVVNLIEKYEVDYLVVYNNTNGIELLNEMSNVMWSDGNFSLIRF